MLDAQLPAPGAAVLERRAGRCAAGCRAFVPATGLALIAAVGFFVTRGGDDLKSSASGSSAAAARSDAAADAAAGAAVLAAPASSEAASASEAATSAAASDAAAGSYAADSAAASMEKSPAGATTAAAASSAQAPVATLASPALRRYADRSIVSGTRLTLRTAAAGVPPAPPASASVADARQVLDTLQPVAGARTVSEEPASVRRRRSWRDACLHAAGRGRPRPPSSMPTSLRSGGAWERAPDDPFLDQRPGAALLRRGPDRLAVVVDAAAHRYAVTLTLG